MNNTVNLYIFVSQILLYSLPPYSLQGHSTGNDSETLNSEIYLQLEYQGVHILRVYISILQFDLIFKIPVQVLEEKYGGWQNESMINFFNDFANLCFERFGNRVKYWITFNNPWVRKLSFVL